MTQALFREEVVKARSDRLWGDLVISQPIPLRILVWLLTAMVVLAGLFLGLNSYTRKQSVSGWLEPDLGVIEIFPPVPASVSRVLVTQGDVVEKGQILLHLNPDQRFQGEKAVADVTVELLLEQLRLLDQQLEQEISSLQLATEQHKQRNQGIQTSLQQERETLHAELSILALHFNALERVRQLQRSGSLALAAVDEVQLRVLNQQVIVERQETGVLALEHALVEAQGELEQLEQDSIQRSNALLQNRVELHTRLVQQQASQTLDVVAPVSGNIGRLDVHAGQFVDGRQAVISILPEKAVLQARLQVPASAIGFLEAGQTVRFRYSAYAFQKFGVQEGNIVSISENAFPSDTTNGQPVYLVIASLQSQQIAAYGQVIPLRAGIALSADIVLEKRSLLEWLLEPLYSLGKSL